MKITIATRNMIYDRHFNPQTTSMWQIFPVRNISKCVFYSSDPFVGKKSEYCWENAKQQGWISFWHSASFHCVITYEMTGMRWHASMCLHTHYDYTKIPTVPLSPHSVCVRMNFETIAFKAEAFSNQVNCGKHSLRTQKNKLESKIGSRYKNFIK